MKVKKVATRPRTSTPSDAEASESQNISNVCIPEQEHQDQEDTTATSHPMVSKPATTNPEVTFPMSSSVPIIDEFF